MVEQLVEKEQDESLPCWPLLPVVRRLLVEDLWLDPLAALLDVPAAEALRADDLV